MDSKISSENKDAISSGRDRRSRLGQSYSKRSSSRDLPSARYSSFIRLARFVLPLMAIIIAAVVFTWGYIGDDEIAVTPAPSDTRSFGKNELLNPRFESVDEKNQPYTITAERAIQGDENEDVVILEDPLAEMTLNSGHLVSIRANQGAFRRDNQRLLLRGNVVLTHDKGYEMMTAELDMDLEASTAFSDYDVFGKGPAGTLEAKGLKAYSATEHLIFQGPARVVLNRSVTGGGFEEVFNE